MACEDCNEDAWERRRETALELALRIATPTDRVEKIVENAEAFFKFLEPPDISFVEV